MLLENLWDYCKCFSLSLSETKCCDAIVSKYIVYLVVLYLVVFAVA